MISTEQLTETLSTSDLRDRSGASWRQVDYWTRIGLLHPVVAAQGSGSQRRFAPSEVAVARALVTILCLASIAGAAGPVSRSRLDQVLDRIRSGARGRVRACPGIILDLDELCGP